MSRLDQLYKAMQTLNSEGLVLNEDLLNQVSELEEKIIKNEILPIIRETIEPALSPVQRDLVLVVEYSPNTPISVKLTRKRSFVNELPDAKVIEPDPEVEHKTNVGTKAYGAKTAATNLRIIFPNGKIIENKTTVETMVEFIQYVGIEKVRALGITRCRIPLVSNTLDKKYKHQQKALGNGWFVITNTCTEAKRKDIYKISEAYNLGVKVEIVY
jgi:hypothetical protein